MGEVKEERKGNKVSVQNRKWFLKEAELRFLLGLVQLYKMGGKTSLFLDNHSII